MSQWLADRAGPDLPMTDVIYRQLAHGLRLPGMSRHQMATATAGRLTNSRSFSASDFGRRQ